jgi:hypothetical protein
MILMLGRMFKSAECGRRGSNPQGFAATGGTVRRVYQVSPRPRGGGHGNRTRRVWIPSPDADTSRPPTSLDPPSHQVNAWREGGLCSNAVQQCYTSFFTAAFASVLLSGARLHGYWVLLWEQPPLRVLEILSCLFATPHVSEQNRSNILGGRCYLVLESVRHFLPRQTGFVVDQLVDSSTGLYFVRRVSGRGIVANRSGRLIVIRLVRSGIQQFAVDITPRHKILYRALDLTQALLDHARGDNLLSGHVVLHHVRASNQRLHPSYQPMSLRARGRQPYMGTELMPNQPNTGAMPHHG